MDCRTAEMRIDALAGADIDAVLSWRYDRDYASYDLTADDRSSFADPASEYFAIRRHEELIGFVCLGAEARVAGMIRDSAALDVGIGIRPDLTGRGESRWLVPAILQALEHRIGRVIFRAVVKAWNQRALRAAEHGGFQITGTHEDANGSWVLVTRQPSNDV